MFSSKPSRRSNWPASPVIDSPIWKRGNVSCSSTIGLIPSRVRNIAAAAPPGPPPIMSTSVLMFISLLTITTKKALASKGGFRFSGLSQTCFGSKRIHVTTPSRLRVQRNGATHARRYRSPLSKKSDQRCRHHSSDESHDHEHGEDAL